MTDIALKFDPDKLAGDFVLQNGDLLTDDGLQNGVFVSLYVDRRAHADDALPDGTTDRRGWWADPDMGSRLWLLANAKQTAETLRLAEFYADEALQWLVDDGVAREVINEASYPRTGMIAIKTIILRADGRRWEKVWEKQLNG
jgi:phage gp46-like protein